jgi:two-component system cell cycle response regulator DivK
MTRTILIIEDNEMNMEIASILLESHQYHVLQAEDGEMGLELALIHKPDLILMDMHMPSKDGFELCALLKKNPETAHIVIVAFTALVLEEDRKRALASGCRGIIAKPIEVATFVQTVGTYLSS